MSGTSFYSQACEGVSLEKSTEIDSLIYNWIFKLFLYNRKNVKVLDISKNFTPVSIHMTE